MYKPLTSNLLLLMALMLLSAPRGLYAGGLPGVVDGQPLPSLAPMLEKTTPAVVNISTRGSVPVRSNPLFDDPFFRQFFDLPQRAQRRPTQSLGSGVIVDTEQGLVVTNHHVIEDAEEVLVTLSDGREFEAEIIGQDPDADVAVIRIDADDIIALRWADSDALRVGDFVVAIGNPFGLGQTVTSGIVSALGRSGLGIEEIEDFIQTDASINPGNSGGALVNLRGELIGINTAIVGPAGGNVGIGFAIPSNMARSLMQQLVEGGEVRRGKLGISLQELDEDLQEVFGVKRGVVVSGVESDSPADQAGLLRGDVITQVGSRRVESVNDIRNAIGLLRVGDQVVVQFYREKTLYQTDIKVGESEDTLVRGEELAAQLEGAVFENAVSRRGRRYVVISRVQRQSNMSRYGIEAGDIVLAINDIPVETVDDMIGAVNTRSDASLLEIQRGNFSQSVLVR
jgi:serine protease Do/serine protease DegQ